MRLVVRPAVAWGDQPQIGEPEIGHGAGGEADIFAELRVDQNDGGRRDRPLPADASGTGSLA